MKSQCTLIYGNQEIKFEEDTFMKLIIAEKPSVARDIAGVLGSPKRGDGCLEAGEYTVTWAVGHLVTLGDAQDYDEKFKKWNLADLPIVPDPFQLKTIETSKDQFKIVSGLLKKADEVIVATDAGREGQLIYELIAKLANFKGKTKRLWLSSMTEEAIKEAMNNLKNNEEYQNLFEAGYARSQADWLVGINATRAMTTHVGTLLTIGRVQTPTLAMIVHRDQEIANFKPKPYFEIEVIFEHENGNFKGKWAGKEKETKFETKEKADEILNIISGKNGQISKLEQKVSKDQPPQLFDLTSLQRKANQKLGFTADQTLKIVQSLYETHKVLSYPRTDSRYISDDIVPTLKKRLESACKTFNFANFIPDEINSTKRFVDASKVTDHHAIIPTEKELSTSLNSDEKLIYEMVTKQTIACLMESAEWASTTIETVVEGENFKTNGRILIKDGWRAIFGKEGDEDEKEGKGEEFQSNLPKVKENDPCKVNESKSLSKQTTPPSRFNEASLLGAMENAGKQVEDAELAEALKERGLGTPATRASVIEKLKKDEYIKVEKKNLISTEKGQKLIEAITIPILTSPELTGEWEYKLKRMENGEYNFKKFVDEICDFTNNIVEEIKKSTVNIQADPKRTFERESFGKCPLCGGDVVETPKSYGCSNWKEKSCKFSIWKEISGHKITKSELKIILEKGKTKLLKFKSAKTGKDFEALLILKDGKTEFEFEKKEIVKK